MCSCVRAYTCVHANAFGGSGALVGEMARPDELTWDESGRLHPRMHARTHAREHTHMLQDGPIYCVSTAFRYSSCEGECKGSGEDCDISPCVAVARTRLTPCVDRVLGGAGLLVIGVPCVTRIVCGQRVVRVYCCIDWTFVFVPFESVFQDVIGCRGYRHTVQNTDG